MKFFLFKFHNSFDGLLGLDNLKLLQANLDYNKGYIITPYAKIKLQFHKTGKEINNVTIAARSEQIVITLAGYLQC